MQVTKKTWDRLGALKKWPDRMNFDSVIAWLVEEHQNREDAKELL